MKENDIEMGVFVAHAGWSEPSYVRGNADDIKALVAQAEKAVECAKRVNARWATIVPGPYVNNREWDYQTANVVKCLREMAAVCEGGWAGDGARAAEPLGEPSGHVSFKNPAGQADLRRGEQPVVQDSQRPVPPSRSRRGT